MIKKAKHTGEKMHDGKEKILYFNEEEYALTQHFKDYILLPDGTPLAVSGVGILRNSISAFLMEKLDLISIEHHFIEKINMREQIVQMADILPMKVSISYLACGRYVTDFGMEEGFVFDKPMMDIFYKSKEGFKPIVNEEQIMHFCYMNKYALRDVKNLCSRAGDFLVGLFAGVGIRMVEVTFTIGTVFDGSEFVILIADEISPANCRLWDLNDNSKLDFQQIMQNPEDTMRVYQEVLSRLGIHG